MKVRLTILCIHDETKHHYDNSDKAAQGIATAEQGTSPHVVAELENQAGFQKRY